MTNVSVGPGYEDVHIERTLNVTSRREIVEIYFNRELLVRYFMVRRIRDLEDIQDEQPKHE